MSGTSRCLLTLDFEATQGIVAVVYDKVQRCILSYTHFSRLYDTQELTLGLFYSGHHMEDYNDIVIIPDTDDELILARLYLVFLAKIVRRIC
ncbi:hypothetical protein TNCV_2419741 [Trichonephila clavipes]|nr:hypothetical protein TNCV_2419741 [Trichonephila clavipes]